MSGIASSQLVRIVDRKGLVYHAVLSKGIVEHVIMRAEGPEKKNSTSPVTVACIDLQLGKASIHIIRRRVRS
jgi:hypothetical protein